MELTKDQFVLSQSSRVYNTGKIAVNPDTDNLIIRLRRPTTLTPLAWDSDTTVKVSLVDVVDGKEYVSTSQFTGGIRVHRRGHEITEAIKSVRILQQADTTFKSEFQQDGKNYLTLTRPGERAQSEHTVYASIELIKGTAATLEIEFDLEEAPVPTIEYHHSVAFDAAIDAQDTSGDGVITVSMNPVGTTNLAAFAGSGNSTGGGGFAGSVTYDGVTMTEDWDVTVTNFTSAGYHAVGISADAKNVVNTLTAGTPDEHAFGVIAFTGVHQTNPVTADVQDSDGGANPSVSVSGVNAAGMVVDTLYIEDTSITVGANQLVKNTEDIAGVVGFRQSVQNGSDGGVMSYTVGAANGILGAIAFHPAVDATVALTGTVTSSITESDIVTGGKTIILTVTDDTYVPNTIVTPVIEAGDCTVSGSNTAADPWTTVAYPNAVTGDLLIFCIAWDDSTATTDVAEPAGPNSEVLTEIVATPVTDSGTETRSKAWYTVATGTWTAGNLSFNPTATESWSATCIRIPAGEFDASTPIGAIGTAADAGGGTDVTVDSPAFTAGASDGDGKLVWFAGVDADPLSATPPTGWSILQAQDLGAVAHGIAVRDTEVTDSESIASATWSIAGDSWTSIAFVVRAPTTTPFEDARDNIRDGIDSAQSEATGWDALKSTTMPVTNVVRTSDTVVTITLAAAASYNITAQETITATVPAVALTGAGAVVASPTFTISTAGAPTSDIKTTDTIAIASVKTIDAVAIASVKTRDTISNV